MTAQTINLVEVTLAKMKLLSLAQQQTVVDFIEFLATKQAVESKDSVDTSPRVFGLHAGMGEIHDEQSIPRRVPDLDKRKYRMSDDFNDPLPDEFWLGEEY
jgi:hypothetical protein